MKIQSTIFISVLGFMLIAAAVEAAEPLIGRGPLAQKIVAVATVVDNANRQRSVANMLAESPLRQQDPYSRMVSDFKRQGLPLVNLTQGKAFRVSIGLSTHGRPCVCWYWTQNRDK
jgi:hypothetical protein